MAHVGCSIDIFTNCLFYIFKTFFPILQYMLLGTELQFPDFGQQKLKCVRVSSWVG